MISLHKKTGLSPKLRCFSRSACTSRSRRPRSSAASACAVAKSWRLRETSAATDSCACCASVVEASERMGGGGMGFGGRQVENNYTCPIYVIIPSMVYS